MDQRFHTFIFLNTVTITFLDMQQHNSSIWTNTQTPHNIITIAGELQLYFSVKWLVNKIFGK